MTKKLHPDPDLEALVQRLNDDASESPESVDETPSQPTMREAPRYALAEPTEADHRALDRLLDEARRRHASDLLLVAGNVPMLRCNGRLTATSADPLTPESAAQRCAALLPDARRAELEQHGSCDFSVRHSESGVLRVNVHRERGFWAASVRLLPKEAPEFEALHLPKELQKLAELQRGLILVTGPTGSGKSTTLAALVRRILANRTAHVITIEDPVEFEHTHKESVVEHIEIGRDVESFPRALRSVLRQDPDVILIGEMRDPESMRIAITAAETGHLVLATLHTGDSAQTLHRIVDSYPATQQEGIRSQLAVSVGAVVSQQLLPRSDGEGRIPAVEVLIGTPAVRNLIRVGRVEQLPSQLVLEQSAGMVDLDRSLADLVHRGLVDIEEASMRARSVDTFQNYLRSMR